MYIGTSINESPVIAAQAGQAITNGALLAVAMDADGVKVVSTAGDLLTPDATGKATKAAAGNFILAQALEAATAADQVIHVQIIKAGFASAGSNT